MSKHIHPVPCIHPVQCIVPPHMLEKLATEGTDAQKEKALRTIQTSEEFREERIAATDFAPPAAEAVGKHRIVYDAKEGTKLPGTPARNEGDPPTGDDGVDEAYDGSGATYDLYKDIYQRDSINGSGLRLDSTVHFRKGYDNAFWNGSQMVYGDGDEDLPEADRLFNRFTIAIDIIGHELTHGVTQYEAALVYRNQPGALNESFSDVFGSLVKQRALNQQANQADWLIGQGLFTANVKGVAIRSMKAPGTSFRLDRQRVVELVRARRLRGHLRREVEEPGGGDHFLQLLRRFSRERLGVDGGCGRHPGKAAGPFKVNTHTSSLSRAGLLCSL